MARQLVVATIYHLGTVFNADTCFLQLVLAPIYHHRTVSKADTFFLAESELDSFSK